jgi:D-sedoheptulose 7-phosphate isomerase
VTTEPTGFLYPFIDSEETDTPALLADLAASARAKAAESRRLRAAALEACAAEIADLGTTLAERFAGGARLFCFGNGGSATDAAAFATLLTRPPFGRALPARSLVADEAIVSALGNDVGYDLVFSRQLIAYGARDDVAVGFSTSGNSANVIAAFEQARRRGLATIGFAGYEGGDMRTCGYVDHCFVVASESVHRIQETQSALSLALWQAIQAHFPVAMAS